MATHPPEHVLDNYYLTITLLITAAYQLVGFSIAFTFKFDKLTDFMGGTNFIWLAIITLSMSGTTEARQIVASVFIMLWGARLSGFLLYRILKTGKDDRFDDKRDKFFPFLGFWVFQMLWVWIVSLPVTILNSPNILKYPQPRFGKATDIVGVILYAFALAIETVSDLQKYRFKQSDASKRPGAVCNEGLWKWSRHPNYFGEIMVQVSIFIIVITPASYHTIPSSSGAYAALYGSIAGWVFLAFLLLFLSGLPLQERPGAKKRYDKGEGWPEYQKYLRETSILFPMPRFIWRNMPTWVKRTAGFEWPIYVFDPTKHSDQNEISARDAEDGRQIGRLNRESNRDSTEPLR